MLDGICVLLCVGVVAVGVCCGSCRVVCGEVFLMAFTPRDRIGVLLGVGVGMMPNIVSVTEALGFRGVFLESASSELSFCA